MRDQRETPRDVLRALSKTLAPKSKAISTSSSSSPDDPSNNSAQRRRQRGNSQSRSRTRGRRAVVIPEDPDDSDEFPIDKPRFSLPIDEDADSDGDLPRPPRSSGLEDLEDNYTMQSIEMPRRATLGQQQRYSIRMSDYGPLNDPQSDIDDGGDSAFFPRLNWADDAGDDDTSVGGEHEATIERLDDDAARRDTLGGRISDFGAIDFNLEAADQSTVVLAPQVESSPARGGLSSPAREQLSSPTREGFSPENEPFGFDDDGPPPAYDDGDQMDVEGGEEALPDITVDDDEESGAADLSTETVIIRQMSRAESLRVRKPGKKISKYGIQYPSLPTSVVKRLAQRFTGKSKISPDTLSAIMQASDWFFEQLGDDLQAYAHHANRETINESDMVTLMRR